MTLLLPSSRCCDALSDTSLYWNLKPNVFAVRQRMTARAYCSLYTPLHAPCMPQNGNTRWLRYGWGSSSPFCDREHIQIWVPAGTWGHTRPHDAHQKKPARFSCSNLKNLMVCLQHQIGDLNGLPWRTPHGPGKDLEENAPSVCHGETPGGNMTRISRTRPRICVMGFAGQVP